MSHTRESRRAPSTVGPSKSTRIISWGVLAVALLVLAVTGLLIYDSGKSTRDAEAKADQLTAQLQEFGLRTPSKDQIVRVFDDDGGAVCANPDNGLTRASLAGLLINGAGGPGTRPAIADVRILQGQLAIITVYCPDQLQKFQEYRDSLKTSDAAG